MRSHLEKKRELPSGTNVPKEKDGGCLIVNGDSTFSSISSRLSISALTCSLGVRSSKGVGGHSASGSTCSSAILVSSFFLLCLWTKGGKGRSVVFFHEKFSPYIFITESIPPVEQIEDRLIDL